MPFELPHCLDLDVLTPAYVEDYIVRVNAGLNDWLLKETNDGSIKLYLLQGRVEPRHKKPPIPNALCTRHYLSVPILEHRRAITDVLLSHHHLAIEEMRRTRHGIPRPPREDRLCRFCEVDIETPEHAFLRCVADPEIVALRTSSLSEILNTSPELRTLYTSGISDVDFLKRMIYQRSTINMVAMYFAKVLKVFYATQMYSPGVGMVG